MNKIPGRMIPITMACCLMLLLCHCSTVTPSTPLTSKPKAIDKEKFEGSWLLDDEDGVLQVKFADDGIARLAGLEWKDDHFKLVRGEMHVVEGKDHNFLSVRFEEDGEWEETYFFVPYKFSDQGDLIFWNPEFKEFRKAIEQKLLTAKSNKKESSSIVITNPAEDVLKLLNQPGDLKLFDYKSPTILHKVAGEE